jgi:hypothetical protein
MILFLKILFNTWYKRCLFSLILCKELVHMYDVELGSIWIWKYVKNYFNNLFEKKLKYLKRLPFTIKTWNYANMDLFIINVNVFFSFYFILTLYYIILYWTSSSTKNHCLGIGCLVCFRVHFIYDDWTL